ncbi:MAG: hypothetical protein SFX72_14065 [Isosphaeraceae bacterium]|nr:hypothetical protein [Isosphaeraceae bacterium]
MSASLLPLRVEWDSFLATFPKPGAWTRPCRRKLRLDDDGFSIELVPIFAAARKRLAPDDVRGLDLLVSAVAIQGVPKKLPLDQSSVYVPHCKYKKADFTLGDNSESPIPRSDPGQVSSILDAVQPAALDALTEAVDAEWAKLEPKLYYFQSPKEYTDHLRNWLRILEEIRSHGGGLAIDLG